MRLEDGKDRADIEVREFKMVRGPVVERRVAVFEQRNEFRVQRAQDNQAAGHGVGARREAVDGSLQMGRELGQVLPAEVLELVDGDEIAGQRHLFDGTGQGQEAVRPREPVSVEAERVHRVVDRGQHSCRGGIGNLHVEDRPRRSDLQGPLNERRLANAAPAGQTCEEPPVPVQDVPKLVEFLVPAVEPPVHWRCRNEKRFTLL